MSGIVTLVGWATMICLTAAALALAWAWALTTLGRRAMETKEFFEIVVQYARERNKKRVMGIDE